MVHTFFQGSPFKVSVHARACCHVHACARIIGCHVHARACIFLRCPRHVRMTELASACLPSSIMLIEQRPVEFRRNSGANRSWRGGDGPRLRLGSGEGVQPSRATRLPSDRRVGLARNRASSGSRRGEVPHSSSGRLAFTRRGWRMWECRVESEERHARASCRPASARDIRRRACARGAGLIHRQ